MIATLSNSASFLTVSVGNEIRVRDGQKSVTGDVQRISAPPPPVFFTKSTKDTTVKDPLTKDQVQASVARLQETLKQVDPRIEISLEKDINQVIFRVVDKESGELIRQIPSEQMVDLARLFSGQSGLFVEENI
ncbi:MAG: flagellar protein FlaG [Nitrospirales bacterium]|nr:flagellar protein FlaG [Nitrospira sp.]MDR4461983.1 flagellar protein FlaG [Nitrospirales bacterium]MDR4482857.1 flagellar protein FlaG [Nitrospirales bacterium]